MRQNAKNLSTEPIIEAIDNSASDNVSCATLPRERETMPPDDGVQGKTENSSPLGPGVPFSKSPSKTFHITQENGLQSPIQGEIVEQYPDGYKPEYAESIIDFFEQKPKYGIITETLVWKSGEVREVQKKVPNAPPSFREFAQSLGVRYKKLEQWAQKYPEFQEAMEECTEIYKDFLIENGLLGQYPGDFTKFVAKNKVGMKDQTEQKNLTVNWSVTSHLNQIEQQSK